MGIYIPWLADAARMTGYPVVVLSGQATRGHGGFRAVEVVAGHHTATSAKAKGDYPSERIVTVGRSDLPGPLCNYGLGRSGTIYVVAAGVAWHAGASRWVGFRDLNDEAIGIEAESPGYGEWTPAQYDAYPRLVAACLHYMRRDASRYAGHKDICLPPGRKPDPRGIDTRWMQDTVRSFRNDPNLIRRGGGGEMELPMSVADEIRAIVRDELPGGIAYSVVIPETTGLDGKTTERVFRFGVPPRKGWVTGAKGLSAVALFPGGGRTFIRKIEAVEDWTSNGKDDGKRHLLRGPYDLVGRDSLDLTKAGAATHVEITYSAEQPMTGLFENNTRY